MEESWYGIWILEEPYLLTLARLKPVLAHLID
jgi:hypothetical protein